MKKNKRMRTASGLMIAALLTTSMISIRKIHHSRCSPGQRKGSKMGRKSGDQRKSLWGCLRRSRLQHHCLQYGQFRYG